MAVTKALARLSRKMGTDKLKEVEREEGVCNWREGERLRYLVEMFDNA